MVSGPLAPLRRMRGKTPDPHRHRSPNGKRLKKAEAKVKADAKRSSTPDKPTPKKLHFAEEAKVTHIRAENPAGSGKPGDTMPPKKRKSPKMTEADADRTLANVKGKKDGQCGRGAAFQNTHIHTPTFTPTNRHSHPRIHIHGAI